MIRSVTVTNYRGDSIKLELARPHKSGFAVTKITGLGPGTATINTTDRATGDGSLFNSAVSPQRNIVMSLRYLWHNTVEEARLLTYKYFPLKKQVTLLFETDNRIAEIVGYVESNDPDIFSKTEGSDISIICPDPYFYSAGGDGITTTVFSGVDPLFEFPFECNTDTDEFIEFGTITKKAENVIVYDGEADIGVTMIIHSLGAASNITIYNVGTREKMTLDTTKIKALTGLSEGGMIAGDDIVISTVKRNKFVSFVRDGTVYNILGCLTRDSDWLSLTKGDNIIAYTAQTGDTNLQFTVEHRTAYEGV